jgi:hypothetical protein
MYATPLDLRDRFRRGIDGDEFALLSDEDLAGALTGASSEIDSWRKPGVLGIDALLILKEKCLILARLLANKDQALDSSHPVVRDAQEVRAWLKALLRNPELLPSAENTAVGTIAAPTIDLVYGDAFSLAYNRVNPGFYR